MSGRALEDAVYICLCNGITDRAVQSAIDDGASRPRDIYLGCGCKAQCGNCTPTILSLLRDAREGSPRT